MTKGIVKWFNESKGFGFIEMEGHEARAAMTALYGSNLPDGGFLKVRFEQPRRGGRR